MTKEMKKKKEKENKFSYAKSHLLKDDEVGKPSGPRGQVQLDSGALPTTMERTQMNLLVLSPKFFF